jgi:hypothetical protein
MRVEKRLDAGERRVETVRMFDMRIKMVSFS